MSEVVNDGGRFTAVVNFEGWSEVTASWPDRFTLLRISRECTAFTRFHGVNHVTLLENGKPKFRYLPGASDQTRLSLLSCGCWKRLSLTSSPREQYCHACRAQGVPAQRLSEVLFQLMYEGPDSSPEEWAQVRPVSILARAFAICAKSIEDPKASATASATAIKAGRKGEFPCFQLGAVLNAPWAARTGDFLTWACGLAKE